MGIKNLMKLIQASAPAAVKEITLKELLGRKVAIDASMTIYSFLVSAQLRVGKQAACPTSPPPPPPPEGGIERPCSERSHAVCRTAHPCATEEPARHCRCARVASSRVPQVAVRSSSDGAPSANLTNEAGEVTSHLQGIFSRTIRLMEHGVRPVYVFDGKPPTLKSGEVSLNFARALPAPRGVPGANHRARARAEHHMRWAEPPRC